MGDGKWVSSIALCVEFGSVAVERFRRWDASMLSAG